MGDLIERLRGMNEYWQHAPLYNEAADEIERLETFNRANWAALQEAQRQIERLEAVIDKIADGEPGVPYSCIDVRGIAKAAREDDDG